MKECNQCGKCCIKYSDGGLSASDGEIKSWDVFRPDIYNYTHNGNIWTDPETNQPLDLCPWLRKHPKQNIYTCDIYYNRPNDCKYYPVTIEQMINDQCEMLEERDLANPKQAQKKLNKLMADSRPPFELGD
ncbi:YkgJ family cysteine cluster protein [bacterium]|nr:YkgJ family cysteine cluster protein [bacterium]